MFFAPSCFDLGESLLITTLLGIPLGEPDGKTPTGGPPSPAHENQFIGADHPTHPPLEMDFQVQMAIRDDPPLQIEQKTKKNPGVANATMILAASPSHRRLVR